MILLTGACGFLGKHLARQLADLRSQDTFLCVDRTERAFTLNPFQRLRLCNWEFGDLADPGFVNGLFFAYPITAVVHVAAEVHHVNPKLAYDSDLRSVRALVGSLSGKPGVPLLFVSSLDVVKEKADPYTTSKRFCEYLILENVERYCILRPPLMYGPFDTKNCDLIFRWILKHSWIPTFGNGEAKMTPLFVTDMVRTIIAVLEQRFFPNQIFSVAGDDILTWNDFIDVAATQFGKTITKVAFPRLAWSAFLRAHRTVTGRSLLNPSLIWTLFHDRVYEGSRLKRKLGLTFASFEEGMKITCASYLGDCHENFLNRTA